MLFLAPRPTLGHVICTPWLTSCGHPFLSYALLRSSRRLVNLGQNSFVFLSPAAISHKLPYRFVALTLNEKLVGVGLGEVLIARFLRVLHVEEDLRDALFDLHRAQAKRHNSQGCAHDKTQVSCALDRSHSILEVLGETFAKEYCVWLDRPATLCLITPHHLLLADRSLELVEIGTLLALGTVGTAKCAMALDHVTHVHACAGLKVIDILGHALPEEPLIL